MDIAIPSDLELARLPVKLKPLAPLMHTYLPV